MAYISDSFYEKKLNKYNVNIKTKYIVGNNILERNTDNSKNHDIINGIRCEKDYYINNKLIHKETNFDSRIEYTFISNEMENKEYKCSNCGYESKINNFINGCPYCGTLYNIDYTDKDLGGKYHYDRVLRSNVYRIITGLVDFIISILLCFIFIKSTSRTFNTIDISKIFIYGFILSMILYYFFYILDAYIILGPIIKYKDRQNEKQRIFWKNFNFDKKKFFNNLNYEIRKYYYSKENIIDYDIIDYDEFTETNVNNNINVCVKLYVRIISVKNGKIISEYKDESFIFEYKNKDVLLLNQETNMIKCHNCGASIDVVKGKCEYCNTEIKPLLEWVIKN